MFGIVFEGHLWVLDENGMTIREKISTVLLDEFVKMKDNMLNEMTDEDITHLLEKVDEVINNLKKKNMLMN